MPHTLAEIRKEALETLNKRVGDFKEGYRQNIAVLGPAAMGKTTLLKTFLDELEQKDLILIYAEIVPYEFTIFIRRTLAGLLFCLLKKEELISSRENLENLTARIKDRLPQTHGLIARILSRIDREKPEILFQELFLVIESAMRETQKKCVIVFDEFHNLKHLGVKNLCQDLGKKIMFLKDALFIVASSIKAEARDILTYDLSLLFGNFETLELLPLSTALSASHIRRHLQGVDIGDELTRFLIHFSGGHPLYLKNICREISRECRVCAKAGADRNAVIATLEHALFDKDGFFNLRFSGAIAQLASPRQKNDLAHILSAIAVGRNRLKDLSAHLRRPRKELTQKMNRLLEADLVEKNGSFYVLTDRMMSFWLKFVYHEKWHSLTPDLAEQKTHLRRHLEDEIDSFITASQKNTTDRMLEVFNHFEGDEVQFERRKFRLSSFKELRLIRFEDARIHLGIFGKTQEGLWLAAVKDDGISEHDVHAFVQLAKKYKQKTVKKIIIGLGDIEHNARLLAKEERVTTWDLSHINCLLDIYGKPRIIA